VAFFLAGAGLRQPKALNRQKQKEEDCDRQQNPNCAPHIPPPSLNFFRVIILSAALGLDQWSVSREVQIGRDASLGRHSWKVLEAAQGYLAAFFCVGLARQSRQKSRKRVGANSVYLTVC
jgi:hypothetical protein